MNDGNHHRIESELNCLMMKHSIIQKCACITNKCDIIKEKKGLLSVVIEPIVLIMMQPLNNVVH